MSTRRILRPRPTTSGVGVRLTIGVLAVALLATGLTVLQARGAEPLGPVLASTRLDKTPTVPVRIAPGAGQTGVPVPVATTSSLDTVTPPPRVPFQTVTTSRAAVVVDVTATTEPTVRELLSTLDGVQHVAAVTITTTTLGGVPADIAEVTTEEFRPFTPPATANHEPLWTRIDAGDIAVTHEFGTAREVPLGARLATGLTLPTDEALAFRVGALATNGTPPVADAIVLVGSLPPGGTRQVLVGLDTTASPTATVEALTRAGFTAEEIPDPRAPRSDTVVPVGGITPDNVWDHLAMCESSGDWHINTGNGYYGGIQFLPESWWAVGGTGLPHEHTREEQIYRGTLLWQIQGWEAWPQCARKLGLIVDPPPEPAPTPTAE